MEFHSLSEQHRRRRQKAVRQNVGTICLFVICTVLIVIVVIFGVCAIGGRLVAAVQNVRTISSSAPLPTPPGGTALPALTTAPASESVSTTTTTAASFDHTLCFAGDISVADDAYTTAYWKSVGEDITQCIDTVLVEKMRTADICFVNNEFQYSTRGSALQKAFTFRGDPKNVKVLADLGVDIVSLANNHVYDFGEDALLDTLDTLEGAKIPYVGAGRNLEEASAVYYYDLDGFTVAFLSATRVEWIEQTKGATEDTPGVFRTAESNDLLYQRTKEAAEKADFVVVYMHWGQEAVTYQEAYQVETGHALIDCGADVVVGDHPHWLQGIEFYDGKPILYSMGNYWFNGKSMDTMLAQVHLSGTKDDFTAKLQLVPARQTNCQVIYYDSEEEQDTFYRNMEALSGAYGISIDEEGVVSPLR